MERMSQGGSSLSGPVLYRSCHDQFKNLPDFRNPNLVEIPIEDFFMSGLAIFALKIPSLLQFDEEMRRKQVMTNLPNLFYISRPPSDTRMREVIDEYPNEIFRPIYRSLFERAQRAKVLKDFSVWNDTYCLSVDASGCFSSDHVHCKNCLVKKHKDSDKKSFHHQILAGAIVHPEKSQVIPVCPVAIQKQDGMTKNDCEQNAMKRFLVQFREDHPKLKVVLLTDALHSTLPCVELIQKLDMDFILSVKPGSHEKLFEGLDKFESTSQVYHFEDEEEIGDKVKKKIIRHYRYFNGVLLNHQSTKTAVNFLEYWETTQWVDQWGEMQETKKHFSWVTNYSLYESTARNIVKAGRARWKIENETFNTLKNQGYEFEHNFGHGYKNLSSNFAHLMMLAFLVDQLQELKCKVFQTALAKVFGKRSRLWQKLKSIYEHIPIIFSDWIEFLNFFIDPTPWLKSP
ncbi:MAG: transposase [Bdellovibrionales bacterium]|nr:transposase [Bdellovibrionales bacterium]